MTSLYQFPISKILIQPGANTIGPFAFNLGPQLPTGTSINSVDVVSSLDGVDTTSKLIAKDTLSGNIVSVYFSYPSSDLHGQHKLTLTYTLDNGAIDEADFFYIQVASV